MPITETKQKADVRLKPEWALKKKKTSEKTLYYDVK